MNPTPIAQAVANVYGYRPLTSWVIEALRAAHPHPWHPVTQFFPVTMGVLR